MRVVSINEVDPGMVIGRTIYSADGRVLLANGVRLTPELIDRLNQIGVLALYIYDDNLKDIQIEDVVSEKTRADAIKITKDVMKTVKINPSFDLKKVLDAVDNIVDELIRNRHMAINLIDLRAKSEYLFGHSVNVAVLSILTGIAMEYNQLKLRALAAGAILHDIGKSGIDEKIIKKVKALTDQEKLIMKQHTTAGFEILRKIGGFSLLSAHVALEHHEMYDGSGYPRGMAGIEICEFARVVSIADVYDKMTTDSEGHRRLPPFQAVEIIAANKGKLYDPEVVDKFIGIIAVFPAGSEVMLNTGEKAVVVKTFKDRPTKPNIRVVENHMGEKVNNTKVINLQETPELSIISPVE